MKSFSVLSAIMLCLSVFGQSENNLSMPTNTLQIELAKANSNNVTRIEIFFFPEEIATEFAVSPNDLEKVYWTKTIIADFKRTQFSSLLLHSLTESNIQPRNGKARDLRWGCVFFDSKGTRIMSLYFDQFGKGEVNGIQIESNGKFLNLLREKFALR